MKERRRSGCVFASGETEEGRKGDLTVEMSASGRDRVRPHWTKFVRHIYLFDYEIKYISSSSSENNPSQCLKCFLNTKRSPTDCSGCSTLSQLQSKTVKGNPVSRFFNLLSLNSKCFSSPTVSKRQNGIQTSGLFSNKAAVVSHKIWTRHKRKEPHFELHHRKIPAGLHKRDRLSLQSSWEGFPFKA